MCPIKIQIGSEQRDLPKADPSWINMQINRHRDDGQSNCVRVSIHSGDVNIALTTPTCNRGGGGGRSPNRPESQMLAIWNELGLNDSDFSGGQVVAFLKRACQLIGTYPPSFLHQTTLD